MFSKKIFQKNTSSQKNNSQKKATHSKTSLLHLKGIENEEVFFHQKIAIGFDAFVKIS